MDRSPVHTSFPKTFFIFLFFVLIIVLILDVFKAIKHYPYTRSLLYAASLL